MKKVLTVITLSSLLLGCSDPFPVTNGTAEAVKTCLDKGWIPDYYSNHSYTKFKCTPPYGILR